MKYIILSNGLTTIVDDEDFGWLNQWKWQYSKGYAVRSQRIGLRRFNKKKNIKMHREILKTPRDMETDHINNNKLDNRKSNLRIATGSQNRMNTKAPSTNTSGYKGIYWHKQNKKWFAKTKFNGKGIYLGYALTVKEAALIYNKKIKNYHGEFARLNQI